MGFPVGALIGSLSGGSSSSYNYNNSQSSGFTNSQSQSYTDGTTANQQAISNAQEANSSAWEAWEKVANYNAEQARIQREWEERMANTQYQRAIQDMEKAGLNPILAIANGISGAGTGAGSSASMSVPNSFMADTFANSASSSSSHGENQSKGGGEGWSNSTNGLAEGLGQLGNAIQGIVGAINSSKGVEGAKDKLGEIVGQAGESAKEIGEGIKNAWHRFKYGWFERNGHQQSGGGHKF